jgi:hypothetical protein
VDNETIDRLFAPLWADVRHEDSFEVQKPLLAHYTSLEVLEKIIQSNEIWLSNPLLMNDVEELKFGILESVPRILGSEAIQSACQTPARAELFRNHFGSYFNQFANVQALDTYVFCFSEHSRGDNDGLLSMWRGYGGNGRGVAVVFDTSQIEPTEPSALILAKAHYLTAEQRLQWIDGAISTFSKLLASATVPDEKLHVAAHNLSERIKIFALYTKHPGFSEEREWRIAYVRSRDTDHRFKSLCGYVVGAKGIEPKLKLKIAPMDGVTTGPLSLERLIERIILGPSQSSPLAYGTVTRTLEQQGKSVLVNRVKTSGIPLRPI